jgi:hypothetical protein
MTNFRGRPSFLVHLLPLVCLHRHLFFWVCGRIPSAMQYLHFLMRYDLLVEVWSVGWGMICWLRYDLLVEVWSVGWGMVCWLRYDLLVEVWSVGWGMSCWLRYDLLAELWSILPVFNESESLSSILRHESLRLEHIFGRPVCYNLSPGFGSLISRLSSQSPRRTEKIKVRIAYVGVKFRTRNLLTES